TAVPRPPTPPSYLATLSLHDALPICTWRCTTRSPIWKAPSLTAAELAGRRARLQGDVASPRTTPHNAWMLLGVRRFSALAALVRSEEHTSELQSRVELVCRLLLEKKT